jgi:hypothetical protein
MPGDLIVMAKPREFEVEGPFEVPMDETRHGLDLDRFWRGNLERLAECCGCYVLALESVHGSLTPCYIGLTRRRFRDEVFNRSNLSKYRAALALNETHRVVMFLITVPARKGKVSKSEIGELESLLIPSASARRPELHKPKEGGRPNWLIRWVKGRPSGTLAARKFLAAMGIV